MKTVLVIAYKGTAYAGWQVQNARPSVQKTLQNAIEATLGHEVKLSGCSRTDSGVHANEYCCHIDCLAGIPDESLPMAINNKLPDDIAVLRSFTADDDFHSRYYAKGKEYVYDIWNSRIKNPFLSDTAFQYPKTLDVERLNEIGSAFIGEHDFRSFMSAHSKITDCVRTVYTFRAERSGDHVRIYTSANGFLYNMVRIMVGTVLEIHSGRIKTPLEEIIKAGDRRLAGKTAPAHGLYLNKVFY